MIYQIDKSGNIKQIENMASLLLSSTNQTNTKQEVCTTITTTDQEGIPRAETSCRTQQLQSQSHTDPLLSPMTLNTLVSNIWFWIAILVWALFVLLFVILTFNQCSICSNKITEYTNSIDELNV